MSVTITIAELQAALTAWRFTRGNLRKLQGYLRLRFRGRSVRHVHTKCRMTLVHNEAVRRLGVGICTICRKRLRGDGYSNALRNSGAARMLLTYRVHRAGYADAIEEAQQAAVGSRWQSGHRNCHIGRRLDHHLCGRHHCHVEPSGGRGNNQMAGVVNLCQPTDY